MQTIPSFVYLVPIVMLFGVGMVPGVIATIIFALPPIIRLTNLGIRNVREDLVEAADSFGADALADAVSKCSSRSRMRTIMAGLNQTLMLALSMVVIAALIGAGGLGLTVLHRPRPARRRQGDRRRRRHRADGDHPRPHHARPWAKQRSVHYPSLLATLEIPVLAATRHVARPKTEGGGSERTCPAAPRAVPCSRLAANARRMTRRQSMNRPTLSRLVRHRPRRRHTVAVPVAAAQRSGHARRGQHDQDGPGHLGYRLVSRRDLQAASGEARLQGRRPDDARQPALLPGGRPGRRRPLGQWLVPAAQHLRDTIPNGAELVGYVAKGGALQGYLIDKATADKYDIKTLDDFKRRDQEGVRPQWRRQGGLVACPPGWGCEITIEHQLDAYGLGTTSTRSRPAMPHRWPTRSPPINEGKPILFYTWTPNWTVNTLKPGKDVIWIEVPKVDLPEDQKSLKSAATLKGVEGCVEDPCKLGFPANDIRPVANSAFLKDNPAAKALLEEVSIPIEDIFAQNAKMNDGEGSAEDIKRQASEWIEAHGELVDGWLDKASGATN